MTTRDRKQGAPRSSAPDSAAPEPSRRNLVHGPPSPSNRNNSPFSVFLDNRSMGNSKRRPSQISLGVGLGEHHNQFHWVGHPTFLGSVHLSMIWGIPRVPGGYPRGSVVKHPLPKVGAAGDLAWVPGSRRSPGGVHGNPLQYSCLEDPMG